MSAGAREAPPSARALGALTWEEVRDLDRAHTVAILPVGAIEAHGPHLPLVTDVVIAEAMARAAAARLAELGRPAVILPSWSYSAAPFAAAFPGTISMSASTVTELLLDLARALTRQRFAALAVANAHLDPANRRALAELEPRARAERLLPMIALDVARRPWAERLGEEFASGACHAGRYEGSIVMAERPDLVREDVRRALPPNPASLAAAIRSGVTTFERAGGPRAYFGWPADASAEEGRATVATLGAMLAEATSKRLEELARAAVPRDALAGRGAVVTGGGRGIGAAIAHALAAAGARVVVAARSGAEVDEVARAIVSAGGAAWAARCDVTDEAQVRALRATAEARLGAVDVLVNNAGDSSSSPLDRLTLEEWNRILAVNATGTFLCTREFAPGMRARGFGRIVNVASLAGLEGARYVAHYSAAKHAVVGLTRSAALELEGSGVTVNAVCPGYVDSPMTERTLENVGRRASLTPERALAAVLATTGQERLTRPEEVASLVVELCLSESAIINGRALPLAAEGAA